MNLESFFKILDSRTETIPLPALKQLLSELTLDVGDVEVYLTFDANRYQRNRVRKTETYEALFLCFEAGQRTPVHDHAGSACGVKVIRGTGTETIFNRTEDGWLYATKSQQLAAGGVVGSNDMDTHQLSNLQPDDRRLVTLHIYSPPLGEVGNYSLTENRVVLVHSPANELDWNPG